MIITTGIETITEVIVTIMEIGMEMDMTMITDMTIIMAEKEEVTEAEVMEVVVVTVAEAMVVVDIINSRYYVVYCI
jgi:hypothetical protein